MIKQLKHIKSHLKFNKHVNRKQERVKEEKPIQTTQHKQEEYKFSITTV
jgi:hypothetical protein